MHRAAQTPVALVGCGRWGRHILRDLTELGARVIVADTSRAARDAATIGGAFAVVRDIRELPAVAGAVVATPTRTHGAVLEQLLPRAVPIFCEKPLTVDAISASRLAAIGSDRLFVMDKWRYHPGVEALRHIAAVGELGPVYGLRTTRIGWANPHADVDPVWILAPHDLAIGLEILGHLPTPRSARAERLDGRMVGLLGMLGDTPWLVVDVSVASTEMRREVRLYAADGVAILSDAYSDHLAIVRPGGRIDRRPISTEMPLRRELDAFLSHLSGGPTPKSSAAEAAEIVRRLESLRALTGVTPYEGGT